MGRKKNDVRASLARTTGYANPWVLKRIEIPHSEHDFEPGDGRRNQFNHTSFAETVSHGNASS